MQMSIQGIQDEVDRVMADTGENRQISSRANAKSAETVRRAKQSLSTERATVKKADAAFGRQRGRIAKAQRRNSD